MLFNRLRSPLPSRPLADLSPSPEAFLLCPVVCPPVCDPWRHGLYAWALEQAQAVVRPSLLERDPLAAWN